MTNLAITIGRDTTIYWDRMVYHMASKPEKSVAEQVLKWRIKGRQWNAPPTLHPFMRRLKHFQFPAA